MVNTVWPGCALELDEPAVPDHEVLRNSEPESGAVRSTRDQWIEQGVADMRRNAGAVILELDARDEPVARRADALLESARVRSSMRPRAPTACIALRPRLSIAWMMRCRSRSRAWQARIVIPLDQHTAVGFTAQQVIDVLAELMDIQTLTSTVRDRGRAWSRPAPRGDRPR